MKHRTVNEEVFYLDGRVSVSSRDIEWLKERASATARQRARLCTHASPEDLLHEMFIIHKRQTYVRPHKHLSKVESFHVIEGRADVVLFDQDGEVSDRFTVGEYASGLPFYCRINPGRYHALLIRSELFVFLENTTGPFRREEMVCADWSPDEKDGAAVERYLEQLRHPLDRGGAAIKDHDHG